MSEQFVAVEDSITEFGTLACTEVSDAIKKNIEYIYAALPVGFISPIMTNVPGVNVDSNVWRKCNGGLIDNQKSPLYGTYTPNLQDRYIKMPTNLGESGNMGGTTQFQMPYHNHGGSTSQYEMPEGSDIDDQMFNVAATHAHNIIDQNGETGVKQLDPPYYKLTFYMKII